MKNSNDLTNVLEQLDDRYINEAANFKAAKKHIFVRAAALAACVCLIFGVVFVPKMLAPQPDSVPETETVNISATKYGKVAFYASPSEIPETQHVSERICSILPGTEDQYRDDPKMQYVLEEIAKQEYPKGYVCTFDVFENTETGDISVITRINNLIRYKSKIYVDMGDASEYDTSEGTAYADIYDQYISTINWYVKGAPGIDGVATFEKKSVEGFSCVGTLFRVEFGEYPEYNFASTSYDGNELHANPDDERVVLVKTTLELPTMVGNKTKEYTAFRVYMLYDLLVAD